ALAVLALLVVWGDGYTPTRGALVFAACAVGGFTANVRWRWPYLTFAAIFVLLLSIGQTFEWFGLAHEGRRWLLALLTYASLTVPAYLILAHVPRFARLSWMEETFVVPLAQSALLAIALATLGLPLAVAWDWLTPATACAVWL